MATPHDFSQKTHPLPHIFPLDGFERLRTLHAYAYDGETPNLSHLN